ncbi:MAG: hypothetical protein U9R02_01705 [Thermodesulfobacteriota bacterium]|nr:hypothetical protein [Thermodesulfobacteriota bacterium]
MKNISAVFFVVFLLAIAIPTPVLSQNLDWQPENCLLTPRDQFAGGVIDGKIYVFGGGTEIQDSHQREKI